jgi:hypothetical protein
MNLPSGTWCVVTRNVKDTKSKGVIIKANITEAAAKATACYRRTENMCCWAMPRCKYDTPFAEENK